jgi:hypothetical protein
MPESKFKMLCPFMWGVVEGRKRSSKNYGFSKGLWQCGIARFSFWALSIGRCMLGCMLDIYRVFNKVALLLS